ncbi:MAG: helix-turn-helix transcriptional regulator [Clostridia bacterium]|nr:helix-turn-helix transcriptional regulator [Clostridia bacterium]
MLVHQEHNSKGYQTYNAFQYFNTRWAPHFHKNLELIYVQEGNLTLTVGGNNFNMTGGQYALILSNQIHSFYPNGSVSYWIAVFSSWYVPLFSHSVERLQGITPVFSCDEEIHTMVKTHLIDGEGSLMMKKACLYAVCDQFQKKVPLVERQEKSEDLICRVLDYIAANYRQNLTLSQVADAFGYEYHYLSRILNQDYRINFSKLVNEYRIEHALHLLEETEYSITEIASESGFQSIRSFNHVFHQATGHAPSEHLRHFSPLSSKNTKRIDRS